jgi:hypothetical protein
VRHAWRQLCPNLCQIKSELLHLNGRTPWEVWYERARLTPLFEDVEALYDESAERIRHPDYRIDLQLAAKQELGRNRP